MTVHIRAQTDIYDRYKNGEPSECDTYAEEWLHRKAINSIEDTDPWKLKHNMIAPFKRKDRMTNSQHAFIRRLLGIPNNGLVPRCKHKVSSFVKRCEELGDFSHSSKRHICRQCRCKKAAGFGTKGDWYGIGENTGHYGCGLCREHEATMPRHKALEIAAWDMWTIRYYGEQMIDVTGYEDNVSLEATNASIRIEARKELVVVYDSLKELTENLVPKDTLKIVAVLEQLEETVKQMQFVDPEQGEKIIQVLQSKILERTNLTEYQKGILVPLSTKTEIELKNATAKTVSGIKINDFKLESNSYLHKDELDKRMDMHLSIQKRALQKHRELMANFKDGDQDPDEVAYQWAVGELILVWDNAQTGAKK